MVVAAEVKDAVDRRLPNIDRLLGADHDVAELARPGRGRGAINREGEDVGRPVDAAVQPVQLANALRIDELDGDVPVMHARGIERGRHCGAKLGRDVPQVGGHGATAARD